MTALRSLAALLADLTHGLLDLWDARVTCRLSEAIGGEEDV